MADAGGVKLQKIESRVQVAGMASPLARWHCVSSALKQRPELRRYLAGPRLRPAKVAKLSRNYILSPGPVLGPLMDVLPIGAAAVEALGVEWLKAHRMVHSVGSHHEAKRQANASPLAPLPARGPPDVPAASLVPSIPFAPSAPAPPPAPTIEKRSRKNAKVLPKRNSPIPCCLGDGTQAGQVSGHRWPTVGVASPDIFFKQMPSPISPLAPPRFVQR